MMNIRPVSDLRNKFPEVEEAVLKQGEPVFLTKNGYGTMVLLSLEQYGALTEGIAWKLDQADNVAASCETRYTGEEVFGRVRGRIHGSQTL